MRDTSSGSDGRSPRSCSSHFLPSALPGRHSRVEYMYLSDVRYRYGTAVASLSTR